jgi:murein DD-endopeptidase MepM/ murein hydrolase activator NlpD
MVKTPDKEIAEARKGNDESKKIYTEMIDYQKNRVQIMKDLGEYLSRFSDITKEVFDQGIKFLKLAIEANWNLKLLQTDIIGGAKPESEGGIGENFGTGPRRNFKGKPPTPPSERNESTVPKTKTEPIQPNAPPSLTEKNKSRVLEDLTKWTGIRESNKFGAARGGGRPHAGIDLGHTLGDPVVARAGGRVDFIGGYGGYGHIMVVDIGQGSDGIHYSNLYAHLLKDSASVQVGDMVKSGDAIANVGNSNTQSGDPTKVTGPGPNHWRDSTGQWYNMPPHLHLELHKNYTSGKYSSGTPVDPESWNQEAAKELREYFKKQTIKEDKISSTNPPYTSGSADGYVQLADGRQIPVELLGNYSEVLTAMNSLVDTLDAHSSVLEDQLVVVG